MTRYMLDTDTASYVIKGQHPDLDRRLASVAPSDVCISSITRAELMYGVRRKPDAHHLARVVGQFLAGIATLAWDDAAADSSAKIAADLARAGTRIGTFDTMIAAHALGTGAAVVTNSVAHFSRVAGLEVENWTEDEPPRPRA